MHLWKWTCNLSVQGPSDYPEIRVLKYITKYQNYVVLFNAAIL